MTTFISLLLIITIILSQLSLLLRIIITVLCFQSAHREDVGIYALSVKLETQCLEYTHSLTSRPGVDGSRVSFSMSYDGTVTKWDKVQRPDIAVGRLSMCPEPTGMEI